MLPSNDPETALRGFRHLLTNEYFLSLFKRLDLDFQQTMDALLDATPGEMSSDVVFNLLGEARGFRRLKTLLQLTVDHLEQKKQESQSQTEEQKHETDTDSTE